MKLSRYKLKKLIQQEVRKLVDEDAIFPSPRLGEPHYVDDQDLDSSCPTCGDYHDHEECPGADLADDDVYTSLVLEACGCGGSPEPAGMDDYSLDSMAGLDPRHYGEVDPMLDRLSDMGAEHVDIGWADDGYSENDDLIDRILDALTGVDNIEVNLDSDCY